jgi:hypothetical protein
LTGAGSHGARGVAPRAFFIAFQGCGQLNFRLAKFDEIAKLDQENDPLNIQMMYRQKRGQILFNFQVDMEGASPLGGVEKLLTS